MNLSNYNDHGGRLDDAVARFGGVRSNWVDLSTGINPVPFPIPDIAPLSWSRLPDDVAVNTLDAAARNFWQVPPSAAVLAAPGVSALIARIPALAPPATVCIPGPTYSEHESAFLGAGWRLSDAATTARVLVHPNNPNGKLWPAPEPNGALTIIDESFCDVVPQHSHVNLSVQPGTVVLKSFGKFWGLAGLRLGFAIGDPTLIEKLGDMLGPWPVSGPALQIGAAALSDQKWARETRQRLSDDADRLDRAMLNAGADLIGGTSLFRLFRVDRAQAWQDKLAVHHIWSRIFGYSDTWLRLGIPAPDLWDRLEAAL